MKGLLILSLVANVALVGTVGYLVTRAPATTPAGVEASAKQSDASAPGSTTTKVVVKKTAGESVTNTVVHTIDWRKVESEDYKKYIANMRGVGCPEETIRDIIIADVNKLFESRKQALKANKKKYEFWKSGQGLIPGYDDETVKQQQALAKEKRALLRELLGVDVDDKADVAAAAMNPLEMLLDFLPSSKQTAVMELLTKAQAEAMKSMKGGAPDSEDLKQIQKVKKDMQDELAKILSPEEMQDYQLRLSDTAMVMRMQMAYFDTNEEEFKDIFKLKQGFDDKYPMMLANTLDKDEKAQRDAAQKELDNQLKTLLGDSRFNDLQRSQDWAYGAMAKVADREGLPRDAANKVYDMKKAAEESAKSIRADKSLSDAARKDALQNIRTETERSMQQVFGDKGYASYQKQPAASWLKGISPDPK